MGKYETALTLICLLGGAAALGATMRSFGATLIIAAAYVTALLFVVGVGNARFDPASVVLLWFMLVIVAASPALIGHNAAM